MGPTCQIDFERVFDIPATGTGKYRYTISEMKRG
jgi:hypothetical protein